MHPNKIRVFVAWSDYIDNDDNEDDMFLTPMFVA